VAELPADGPTRGTVIWLHGIGQDERTLWELARGLDLPAAGLRSVCPRAPHTAQSIAGGAPPLAWFDQRLSDLDRADQDTLAESARLLGDLIEKEAATGGAHRLVLAGFSQGATMALATGLRHPRRLGGLALYAPFIVDGMPLRETRSAANADLPVWIGHGREDWIVPVFTGVQVRIRLQRWGHPVDWHTYPAGHEPFVGAAADLHAFLDAALPPD
jgi:phospholipase/carboxylesterase